MKTLRRITALICVAALLITSMGVGNIGYAYEKPVGDNLKISSPVESKVFNPRNLEIYEEGISTFAFNNVYNGSYRSQLSENEQNYYDQLKAALLVGDHSDPSSIRPREDVADSLTLVEATDYKLPAYVEYGEDGNGTIKLTEEGKEQYNAIYNELFYAYFALTHDYPILFWYAGGSASANLAYKGDLTALEVDHITFEIKEAYPNAKSQIAAFNTGLENTYNLLNTKENTKDEYTTIKAIHDYLCEHITYNHDAVTNAGSDDYKYAHSPGVVFIQENSSVVCEGYGEAFKILCDMFGIPCALVMGTGNGGAHLWNYVQVEGNWYAVDVTWDDQSTITYNFFMKGSENFVDHTPENNAFSGDVYYNFAYPTLSEKDYVYVEKTSISDMTMTGVIDKVATGNEITQNVAIGDLVLGTDYILEYENNISCGTATVTAKGIGEYKGSITKTFKINHNKVKDAPVAPTCTETGLTEGEHCSVCKEVFVAQEERAKLSHTPAKAITENKVSATCTADGSYDTVVYCSVDKCKAELSRETITVSKVSSVKLSKVKYTYDNTVKKPMVTVKDAQGTGLVEGRDFDLVYASGRKAVGKYSVTINLKGNYSGSKTLYFTIVPKAPATATANLYGYDDIKFSWAKSTGASGYNVYYKKSTASSYMFLKETTSNYIKKADLADGVKYTFKVVPYYKVGKTKYTSLTSKVAGVYTLKQLAIPATTKSGTKVKVKWNNINGETGYQISKSTSKTGTNIVATYKTTSGTYKLVNATKGKTYYYKVRAYKVVGKTSAGKDIRVYVPWSKVKAFKR